MRAEIGVVHATTRPPSTGVPVRRYAWVVLAVVFLAGIAASLSQAEVPPVLPILMEAFRVNLSAASSLMSVFAVTGAVLALPSGVILQRLGPRTTGAIAIGAVAVGGVVGALAGSFGILLAGRAIEGVGLGLISVVAPTVIALWFRAESRGIPMGIWATWVPLGGAVMLNVAPPLAAWGGWRAVWWLVVGICLVAFALYWVFTRVPAAVPADADHPAVASQHATDAQADATRRTIWLVAATFLLYNVTVGSFSTFYPTFLASTRGYSLSAAARLASVQLFAVIGGGPIAGIVLDRLGSRKIVLTVALLLLAGAWCFPFVIPTSQVRVFLITFGCVGAAVPTAIFAAVPEVMGRAALVGKGMAILTLGQNLGLVIGPVFFSNLVQAVGWVRAGDACVPVLLAAAAVGWYVRVR